VARHRVFFLVIGINSIGRSLPFGLALGASRRSFYTGTALYGVALALVDGLLLTALQGIERATGGWGARMHFFQVPYILDGPWYLTWLTSFVALALLFVWGMWFGIVYRRWNLFGSVTFIAAQVSVVVAAVLMLVWADAWSPLLYRPDGSRADRGARGTGAAAARGRPGHHPPRHRLTGIGRDPGPAHAGLSPWLPRP
jgi:hypothetical protein